MLERSPSLNTFKCQESAKSWVLWNSRAARGKLGSSCSCSTTGNIPRLTPVAATASKVALRRIPQKHLLKSHFGSSVSCSSCMLRQHRVCKHCEIVAPCAGKRSAGSCQVWRLPRRLARNSSPEGSLGHVLLRAVQRCAPLDECY